MAKILNTTSSSRAWRSLDAGFLPRPPPCKVLVSCSCSRALVLCSWPRPLLRALGRPLRPFDSLSEGLCFRPLCIVPPNVCKVCVMLAVPSVSTQGVHVYRNGNVCSLRTTLHGTARQAAPRHKRRLPQKGGHARVSGRTGRSKRARKARARKARAGQPSPG